MLSCLWCLVGKQDCCLISSTSTPAGRSGSRLWGQTTFFHTLLSWCKIQQRMKDKVRRCLLVLFQHNLATLFYLSPLRLVRTRRLKWSRQKKGRRERADNLFFSFWCVIQAAASRRSSPPQDDHILHVYFAQRFKAAECVGFLKRLSDYGLRPQLVHSTKSLDFCTVTQSAVKVNRHSFTFANLQEVMNSWG